jgi:hypothetical protein
MRRLKDYLKVIAWQAGLGYLLIWAITFWTLDDGARVFGASGVCLPDQAKVLFYWACEAKSPLSILASLANAALTLTVWAPVYVAAATVKPDAMAIAVPILAVHAIGLPLGMFVLIRMLATALDLRRKIPNRARAREIAPAAAALPAAPAALAVDAPAALAVDAPAGPAAFFPVATPAAPPAFVPPVTTRRPSAGTGPAGPPRNEFGLRSRKADGTKRPSK